MKNKATKAPKSSASPIVTSDETKIALLTTCVIIIIINIIVLIITATHKKLRKLNYTLFFANVMAANVLLAAAQILHTSSRTIYTRSLIDSLVIAGMANLSLLTADRMYAICYPMRYIRTRRWIFVAVFCAAWIIPMTLFILFVCYSTKPKYRLRISGAAMITVYGCSCAILATTNTLVYRQAKMQIRKIKRNTVHSLGQLTSIRRNQISPICLPSEMSSFSGQNHPISIYSFTNPGDTHHQNNIQHPSAPASINQGVNQRSTTHPTPIRSTEHIQVENSASLAPPPTRQQNLLQPDRKWKRTLTRQHHEIRAAYICFGCVISFLLFWSIYMASLFNALLIDRPRVFRMLRDVGTQIAYMDYIVGPIIYAYLNKDVQRVVRRLLRRKKEVTSRPRASTRRSSLSVSVQGP